MCLVLALLVLAVLPVEAHAQGLYGRGTHTTSAPPVTVIPNACQGEGCITRGTWRLQEPTSIYLAPYTTSTTVAQLHPGDTIEALSTDLHVVGQSAQCRLTRRQDAYRVGDGREVRLPQGAVVTVSTWAGEGNSFGEHRGEYYFINMYDNNCQIVAGSVAYEDNQSYHWVQVLLSDGRRGWAMDPVSDDRYIY